MSVAATQPEPELSPSPPARRGLLRSVLYLLRTRILSGVFAALPVALTIFIVHYLYMTTAAILAPAIRLVEYVLGVQGYGERAWTEVVAPIIAILLVLCLLYTLGLFVQLRLTRAVDWIFLRVPVVNLIFRAINNVFQSLGQQFMGEVTTRRVVLIPFPQPGMRSLAVVTNTLRDNTTGKTILCVCMLTGLMPPAGFTLFIPEEDVTDVDWTMNQSLQVILSGGITTPATVAFFGGPTAPPTGPIVDPKGHPIGLAVTRPDPPEGLPPLESTAMRTIDDPADS